MTISYKYICVPPYLIPYKVEFSDRICLLLSYFTEAICFHVQSLCLLAFCLTFACTTDPLFLHLSLIRVISLYYIPSCSISSYSSPLPPMRFSYLPCLLSLSFCFLPPFPFFHSYCPFLVCPLMINNII